MSKISYYFILSLLLSLLTCQLATVKYGEETNFKEQFEKTSLVKDKEEIEFDESVTSEQLFNEMGFGWNLGNTLDAYSKDLGDNHNQGIESETYWGNPETTEKMFKELVKKGIKSVRLPVTWHNHLIDENYTIDTKWISRIKTIVDWAIKNGLYVIINSHHDNADLSESEISYGSGYYPSKKDREESKRFLFNIWKQITIAFNNGYDHHLIFESMNEPRAAGTDCEWEFKKGDPICEEASSILNEYNRFVVDIIRSSGGNNEKRFILVPALAGHHTSAINSDFIFPGDSKYNPISNKILLSVHLYIPYNFAANPDMKYTVFDETAETFIYGTLKNLYERYILHGHDIIIGEMATLDKKNKEERIKWAYYFVKTARKFHMNCVLWDDGVVNPDNVEKGLYQRKDQTWYIDELIDAYLESAETEFEFNKEEEFKDNLISSPITFVNWENKLQLSAGLFNEFTPYSKLSFSTDDPDTKDETRKLNIFTGDWSVQLKMGQEEVIGAVIHDGSIEIGKGETNVDIVLNKTYTSLAKESGLVVFGVGVKMTKIYISGPKLKKIDPIIINKSDEEQKVSLYFSEDASPLEGNIIFENIFYNINDGVECNLDKKDKKVIICKGIFNFTGEYTMKDNFDMVLTNRPFIIAPEEGDDYDIQNLIDYKINLDDLRFGIKINLDEEVFEDVKKGSKLVIEVKDLNYQTSFRTLFITKKNSDSVITFSSDDINVQVSGDGGFIVPKGRQLIKININKNMDDGISIKGYGLSLNTIYIE